MPKEMKVKLVDDPSGRTLEVVVRLEGGGLTIMAEGRGEGDPVAGLAMQDGRLRMFAFNGGEEPVTIDLNLGPRRRQDWRPLEE